MPRVLALCEDQSTGLCGLHTTEEDDEDETRVIVVDRVVFLAEWCKTPRILCK